MDRLLYYVFAGSRGGPTRTRMVLALLEEPMNAHRLARHVGIDYKTAEYNLRVLVKHVYVVPASPDRYGRLYAPSKNLLALEASFRDLAGRLTPRRTELGKPTNTHPAGGESP